MIQTSEDNPIILSAPIVKLGHSKMVTFPRKWGLDINEGDVLTLKVRCADGEERYSTQAIKVRQRCLRAVLPPSWPLEYNSEYEIRIVKYLPGGGTERIGDTRSRTEIPS